MGIFRQFPYTNFHELNEDWLIAEVKRLADEWLAMQNNWQSLYEESKAAIDDFKAYVRQYFDDLDVEPYVIAHVDELVADGTMDEIVLEKLSPVVSSWLNDHITVPSGVVIDSSLSVAGACADAKAAGDGIKFNYEQIKDSNYMDLIKNRAQTERTYNGVTYHWLNENCKLTGTASPFSFCNLVYSMNEMPAEFVNTPGKNLLMRYENIDGSMPTSTLQVIFYNNGNNIFSQALRGYNLITVPDNADGVVVRIAVNDGDSVNETVRMALYSADPINIINNYVKPLKFGDRLPDNFDLNDCDLNSIHIDVGNCVNAPTAQAGFVYTIGKLSVAQIWMQFNNGDMYYRRKTINNVWSTWLLLTNTGGVSGNGYASMLSMGNSILNGAVYINSSLDHLAQYGNAPYSIIAEAMNIPRANVQNELHSSTGLLYDAGEGSFLDNLMTKDLSNIDVVVTHLWTADMNYPVGNTSSAAGIDTLVGAVKTLLNYIKTQNKNCQLVLIGVPPCSYTIEGNTVFSGVYPNGSSIASCDTVLHQLADQLHFTFVDWEDLNLSYYYQDLTDGNNVHANNDSTYRIMGAHVAGRISSEITF